VLLQHPPPLLQLLLQRDKQHLRQAQALQLRQARLHRLLPPRQQLPLNPPMATPVAATIIQHAHPAPGAMHLLQIVSIPAAEKPGLSPIPLALPCMEIALKIVVGAAILWAM